MSKKGINIDMCIYNFVIFDFAYRKYYDQLM